MKKITLVFLIMVSLGISAQDRSNEEQVIRETALSSFSMFFDMLSIPNNAYFPDDIENNVKWCENAFSSRGFKTQRLETSTVPLLLADRKVEGAEKTVLIYLQIDGQPVDSSKWDQDSPWLPTLKKESSDGSWSKIDYDQVYENPDPDWRIFARAASDAKGPAAAFLASLDAAKAMNVNPNYSIKVIMDFEEELGSPRLPKAVSDYKEELSSDMLIIYDGPRHVSNQPTLTFGARGICTITLKTFGPRKPVHSGNYGNYTPNPAMRLAQILASMKDAKGRVTIEGFYDGIEITESEKQILAQVPDDEAEINVFLGIAQPDQIGDSFQESLQFPTLNIRGMNSLYVGEKSRTLIPAVATAEIDIRLVPTSDPVRLIGLVKKQVEDQGYFLVDGEPSESERMKYPRIASFESNVSYGAFQTPFDSEVGEWLNNAMTQAFGNEPIKLRTAGGSIPISPFVITLGIPAVAVPTVNADNNQHAPNENIRVGNYLDAVKTFYFILKEEL